MNIAIVGINPTPDSTYNLAPALLKSYSLKDDFIRKHATISLKWFSVETGEKDIIREILSLKPALIGFSCYVWNINKILRLSASLRKIGFKGAIVLGGPEVSAVAREVLVRNPAVDIIAQGEGEVTFRDMVRCLLAGQEDLQGVRGIATRLADGIVEHEPQPLIEDLDEIPSPYLTGIVDFREVGITLHALETLRGCLFHCNYCLWGSSRRIRYFSLERVRQELLAVMGSSVKRVWIADPTCNFDRERFKQILRIIAENNTNGVIFDLEMNAEFLDEETVTLLTKLPAGYIAFGLQSTDPVVLRNINRAWNRRLFERNLLMLQKKVKRMEVRIDLIYGLPGDSYKSFSRSFAYAMSLQPFHIQVHRLQVLPGSHVYNNAAGYGIAFMKNAPHFFLKSRTLSPRDCRRIDLLSNLYDDLAVRITVNELSKYLRISHWKVFVDLLSYLSKRMGLKRPKSRLLLKHLNTFMRNKASMGKVPKQLLPIFQEILRYYAVKIHEVIDPGEKAGIRREAGMPQLLAREGENIKVEKFQYDVKGFFENKLCDRFAGIKDIEEKPNLLFSIEKTA